MRQFQGYLQKGKRISGKHTRPVSRQQMCPNGHNTVRKAYGNLGGEVEDMAGKQVMECEMCTENNKEGRGWVRQWQ
jgi:hypothetical protein